MPLNFERSESTAAVVMVLRETNGEASYERIAAQAHMKVHQVKAVLPSARRILRRDKILFGTITGVGLKRLSDQEKVVKSESTKKRIANAAKRGLKELETIEAFDRLSGSDQLIVTTNRTILNMTRQQLMFKPPPAPPAVAVPELPSASNLARLRK